MKKLVLVFVSLLLVLNGYGLVKRSINHHSSSVTQQKEDKLKIKKEELPETVKKTLEGEAFKGWALTNAYKMNNSEYEVELKKGTNVQTVKFDKDGKVK
jgi:hypothetical protein